MVNYIDLTAKEIEELPQRKRTAFVNSIHGFKPSNLLGTISENGVTNLSIISSVFHLGANPPLVGLIIRPDSVPRDSLNNIRANKVFTLNHVNQEIVKKAHQVSARYPEDMSEFDACELTAEFLNEFKAPFVKESLVKYALELVREIDIVENGTHMLIGKILNVSFIEGLLLEDGSFDLEKAQSVVVKGLDHYYTTKEIGQLTYAKPDQKTEWIKN